MDRLRAQAGDWLYVNYFDADMSNSGDFPIISIAAKDGSPVNIIDAEGRIAEDILLLSTGIQGVNQIVAFNPDGSIDWTNSWTMQTPTGMTPPPVFSITVAGYTHIIDMEAMRDVNGNDVMDAYDLVATINARMQNYDVKAEINKDGRLVLWSPRGYSISVGGTSDADVSTSFTKGGPAVPGDTSFTPYRGGYGLDDLNSRTDPPGIYTQNVVSRSGSNRAQQNFFGVLDDISAAIRAENRDGLSDKLLPMIDKFTDNLLRMISTSGALEARYEGNVMRMKKTDLVLTEAHEELVGVGMDMLAKLSMELAMAQAIYQASLGVMAYIVQPTLLNYLR
jgi:flagellar hook-associated protein 3 FlgL